jgi:hypothetical protein
MPSVRVQVPGLERISNRRPCTAVACSRSTRIERLRSGRGAGTDFASALTGARSSPTQKQRNTQKNTQKRTQKQMTDTNTAEDLELFDDAKEEFPAKEDLKGRLVAIWVTGKHGTRKSEANNSSYQWFETITLVLDDGPDWDGMKIVDGEKRENLVPSVAAEGPQRLDAHQWSTGGLVSRLQARVIGDKPKTFKPMLGRINSRPNTKKGFSASWSISEPTAEDRKIAIAQAGLLRQITAELEAGLVAKDEEAFE